WGFGGGEHGANATVVFTRPNCLAMVRSLPQRPSARGGCESQSGLDGARIASWGQRMTETRFWLIRHAIVDENARAILYGIMDVPLCETSLLEQTPMYQALAARLPRPAVWKVTPLSRTRRTADAIFAAGYPPTEPEVEPDLIEQSLGEWRGLPHAELPPLLTLPKHAFWPLAGD